MVTDKDEIKREYPDDKLLVSIANRYKSAAEN